MNEFACKPSIGGIDDLAVNSDHYAFRSHNHYTHSGLQLRAPPKDEDQKPKYIRMLRNEGAFSGDLTRSAKISDGRKIDIDVSHEGKNWHHFFGKKCFHNKPPLGLEAPNEGAFTPIKKSDNPNNGLEN
jgi:hypothetical protein